MDEWIDSLVTALGEEPLDPRQMGAVLKLARDVAHGVDRKLAPLSAFVAGIHVGRRTTEGLSSQDALAEAVQAARALIPPQAEE